MEEASATSDDTSQNQQHQQSNQVSCRNKDMVENQREKKDVLDTNLSEIGISMMVYNCLKKSGILTVRDIIEGGRKRLSKVRGLNKKMFKEVIDKLYLLGIFVN